MSPNKIYEKPSELVYLEKVSDAYTSAYNRLLNALNKLDTSYNATMQNMYNQVVEGNYKVTGDTRVIPIVDH